VQTINAQITGKSACIPAHLKLETLELLLSSPGIHGW